MKTQDGEILRRSSAFKFLSDEHFAALEPLLQEESYDFGDVIVKQDDPADSFYILTHGRARALKVKGDGEEIPLGALKPGDSFAFVIDGEDVRVVRTPADGDDPFACFSEWASDADRKGYADL